MITAQLLGFLALCVGIYAFSRTDDQQLRAGQAVQSFILALHFYLLGAGSAAAIALLAGIRNSISLYKSIKNIAVVFLIIYIFVGFYTYEYLIDVLPVLSALLGTTAIFYLSGIPMRLLMMFSTSLWIIHNVVVGSVGPLLMELFILAVTARTTFILWKSPIKLLND
jgi:hypothetical protein